VFAPHRAHLFIGREFATRGGRFRDRDSSALVRRKRHGRGFVISPGKPENNAGDIVLSVRRKVAGRLKRMIEKFCHCSLITRHGSESKQVIIVPPAQPTTESWPSPDLIGGIDRAICRGMVLDRMAWTSQTMTG
jgi:hypothetical protein